MSQFDSTGRLSLSPEVYSRLRRLGVFVLALDSQQTSPTALVHDLSDYEEIDRYPTGSLLNNQITYGPQRKGKGGKVKRW